MSKMNLKELISNLSACDYNEIMAEVKTLFDDDFTTKIIKLDTESSTITFDSNKVIFSESFSVLLKTDSIDVTLSVKNTHGCSSNIVKITEKNLINIDEKEQELIPCVVEFLLPTAFITDNGKQNPLLCSLHAYKSDHYLYFKVETTATAEFISSIFNNTKVNVKIKLLSGDMKEELVFKTVHPSSNFVKMYF